MPSATSSQPKQTVNTKKAERREVQLNSLKDLQSEIHKLEQAEREGKVRTTGNWTLAQNIEHMALSLQYSLDGFPFKGPAFMRAIMSLPGIKQFGIKYLMFAGIQLPAEPASYLVPPDDITDEKVFAHMRKILDERLIAKGEKFKGRSPIFGKMSHEQSTMLQLRHCALHLSFLHIEA